jgi:vacuolar-type H+-ATPase subunit E/Vma4
VADDEGMSAIQARIKEAKQAEIDNDPEMAEEKNRQMLEMFRRQAQGCLNRGIPKAQLAAILKELQVSTE